MTTQLGIDFSIQARDAGIQQAIEHADQTHDDWSERAYVLLIKYVRPLHYNDTFLIEDFRHWATNEQGLPIPPTLRAYGSIAVKARKAGLIRFIEYDHVTNIRAHRSTVSRYAKGIV